MERSKLDALFWEQNMFANLIVQGETDIEQENLDNIPFECIDEFRILRDDNYNIKLICNKNVNQFSESAIKKEKIKTNIYMYIGYLFEEQQIGIISKKVKLNT